MITPKVNRATIGKVDALGFLLALLLPPSAQREPQPGWPADELLVRERSFHVTA